MQGQSDWKGHKSVSTTLTSTTRRSCSCNLRNLLSLACVYMLRRGGGEAQIQLRAEGGCGGGGGVGHEDGFSLVVVMMKCSSPTTYSRHNTHKCQRCVVGVMSAMTMRHNTDLLHAHVASLRLCCFHAIELAQQMSAPTQGLKNPNHIAILCVYM